MSAQTYRKKPVTVEAIQWTGDNADEVRDFVGQISSPGEFGFIRASYARPARLWVAANQEWLLVEPGEWVLKDKLGFYPCKDEMFQHGYEPVTIATEQCDACADPGMTFDQASDLDRGLALCTNHWNRWVLRWINSDDEPGVSAHLIQGRPVVEQ